MPTVVEQIQHESQPETAGLSNSYLRKTEMVDLIVLSRIGDQAAFSELIRRIRIPVRALALRVVNNPDDAADIAQLTFLKVWGNLHLYDSSKPFMTWLYRITVNTAIDFKRSNKRHKHGSLVDIDESSLVYRENGNTLERIRLRGHVTQAAFRLKAKQKQALYLRDVIGSSIEAMTDEMNIPEPTARWHLHQARMIVRKELRRRCPELLFSFGVK